ncbi:MAG: L,D-transpeptidase [Bacteroidota bacterium]
MNHLFIILALLFGSCQLNLSQKESTHNPFFQQQIPDSLVDDLFINIHKADRSLEIRTDSVVFMRFPIVLGLKPEGDKQMQGDRKTPEGRFKIRDLYPHDRWTYFIWLDYPTQESRRRFAERKNNGQIPASASIGGEIGIHGVPAGRDDLIKNRQDWTWGCISLNNTDIQTVYQLAHRGMEVVIWP